jgi:hypothetical protein
MTELRDPIRAFQRKLYHEYAADLELPGTYKYLYGNPIRPVVPIDTATGAVMIIGRHPETVYAHVEDERDVPVSDVPRPFPSELYFDGQRPRSHTSGAQLEEALLLPLDLQRRQCWLTHLVHVFLLTRDQIDAYRRLGTIWPEHETRSRFEQLAQQSIEWLAWEVVVAKPRLILTLGADLAGILQGISGPAAREALLDGSLRRLRVAGQEYPVIHLAEPGSVIRYGATDSPWPKIHTERHLPAVRQALRRYLGQDRG